MQKVFLFLLIHLVKKEKNQLINQNNIYALAMILCNYLYFFFFDKKGLYVH